MKTIWTNWAKHIDNEDAQNILANFGRISAQTTIVLCFDQLDNIPRLPDGSIDLKHCLASTPAFITNP